jgi:hypothetical protein
VGPAGERHRKGHDEGQLQRALGCAEALDDAGVLARYHLIGLAGLWPEIKRECCA